MNTTKYPPRTQAKNMMVREKKFPPGTPPFPVKDITTAQQTKNIKKKNRYFARFPCGGHSKPYWNLWNSPASSGRGLYFVLRGFVQECRAFLKPEHFLAGSSDSLLLGVRCSSVFGFILSRSVSSMALNCMAKTEREISVNLCPNIKFNFSVTNKKSVSNYSLSIPPQSATKICHIIVICRKINYVVKQEVDKWQTWQATCRTPSRSILPSLKWLWCMVAAKSVTENIGYRWKDGQS